MASMAISTAWPGRIAASWFLKFAVTHMSSCTMANSGWPDWT